MSNKVDIVAVLWFCGHMYLFFYLQKFTNILTVKIMFDYSLLCCICQQLYENLSFPETWKATSQEMDSMENWMQPGIELGINH